MEPEKKKNSIKIIPSFAKKLKKMLFPLQYNNGSIIILFKINYFTYEKKPQAVHGKIFRNLHFF